MLIWCWFNMQSANNIRNLLALAQSSRGNAHFVNKFVARISLSHTKGIPSWNVNPREHRMDPVSGAQTRVIERLWMNVKWRLRWSGEACTPTRAPGQPWSISRADTEEIWTRRDVFLTRLVDISTKCAQTIDHDFQSFDITTVFFRTIVLIYYVYRRIVSIIRPS